MTIVIKFLTVVTRTVTIKRKYPGGLDAYIKENLVTDAYRDRNIAGVIFMSTGESEKFIDELVSLGFSYDEIALVDMFVGPLFPCPWLGTKNCSHFNGEVKETTCWLKNNRKKLEGRKL